MRILHSSIAVRPPIKNPVVALGNFDGIHLAHQKMLKLTRVLARKLKGTPCVYTFDPHPVKVLSPESSPALISTPTQKNAQIERHQIKVLILEPFTRQFAKMSPQNFFKKILIERLQVKGVVVGYDFTFGAKRSGNVELLEKLCTDHKIVCKVLEPFLAGETLSSSTQIRNFVRSGDLKSAALLLGRPFELTGSIVRGDGLGQKLGFPTANLKVDNELLPASGVYLTRMQIGAKKYRGVTNVGIRPTLGGKKLTVETHLFGLKRNLYGQPVSLQFIKKVRDEKMFASLNELTQQIKKDVSWAKRNFA